LAGDADRKRLWGRAGSRCALCNVELTELDGLDSIVGDEAHIRSRKPNGPRHDPAYPAERLDTYENLILLCKPHHKLVDDNWEVFPSEDLLAIKARHEARVRSALGTEADWVVEPTPRVLATGTDVTDAVMGASAYFMKNCHPANDDEAQLIGGFLQEAQDWGDIADDVGMTGRVQAAMSLDRQLGELTACGLVVIGGRGQYRLLPDLVVPAAVVSIVRTDDVDLEVTAEPPIA
jgi:hypothetical protein